MEVFDIIKKEGRFYTLFHRSSGKTFRLAIKFFDYDQYIQEGAAIAMHKELIDPNYEEYSTEYYFGALHEKYGRVINSKEDIDVIMIKVGDKKIYLKRFFG